MRQEARRMAKGRLAERSPRWRYPMDFFILLLPRKKALQAHTGLDMK